MKFTVEYSKAAILDLDRVWDEIFMASKSQEPTLNYIDGIMDRVEKISDFPRSGSPLYYENSFTGYYFVLFKSYMAFYRLEGTVLYADRVLYAKSDTMRILFPYT